MEGKSRKRTRLVENGENGQHHSSNEVPIFTATTTATTTSVHLDQIQRTNLDFDFEKVCSVTLSPRSVYCCLVCGKFFQGRGKESPLYLHTLEYGHFVAMNLNTAQIYSMPSGQLVIDSSLDDIKFNLKPNFTREEIDSFGIRVENQSEKKPAIRDLHGNRYFPGLIGLNDLHGTDFVNSVVQALVRVKPLRDHFLSRESWEASESRVTRAFGELVCQLFSKRRFKNSASPHELLQAISSSSGKKFQVGHRADASQFLAWLLYEIHKGSGGTKQPMSSFIHESFQGEIRVETTVIELKREFSDEDEDRLASSLVSGPNLSSSSLSAKRSSSSGEELGTFTRAQVVTNSVERIPFLFLSLDLPTNPLFKDLLEGETVIPKTTLLQVLEKYDGVTTIDVTLPGGRLEQKRFRVTKLPKYLVIHLKRFTKNQFFVEKNRAIVNLPLVDLDMRSCLEPSAASMSSNCSYNLIANVCHDGGVGPGTKDAVADGTYRANVYYPPQDAWFEMHDLNVTNITMPQLVTVSETFLAFYERASN